MPQQQPESSSSIFTAPLSGPASESAAASAPESNAATHPPHHVPRWLERLELFLRVMLRMYIGLAICYAPWWHAAWDNNPLFLEFPWLGSIATAGAVRGLVSGLGLLNLWIAFQDAIRHRDG
jgi:hypothetical protein